MGMAVTTIGRKGTQMGRCICSEVMQVTVGITLSSHNGLLHFAKTPHASYALFPFDLVQPAIRVDSPFHQHNTIFHRDTIF